MSNDVEYLDDSPSRWYLDQTPIRRALPSQTFPYPYAVRQASPLRVVMNADELESDVPESSELLQQAPRQDDADKREIAKREGECDLGESSEEGKETQLRKDSILEPEDESAEVGSEGSSDTARPVKRGDESGDAQNDSSGSEETLRLPSSGQGEEEVLGSSDETASQDELLDEGCSLQRTSTNFQPGWSDRIPRSVYVDDDDIDPNLALEELALDFEGLDGDWTGPIGKPIMQGELTEENLKNLLKQVAEGDSDRLDQSKGPGPSGEAPDPSDWFRRQPSMRENDTSSGSSGADFIRVGIDERVLREDVGRGPSASTKSKQSHKAPDPGRWLGSGSRSGSRRSSKSAKAGSTESPPVPERPLRRKRKESTKLDDASERGSTEPRKTLIKFQEPLECSPGRLRRIETESTTGEQPTEVAQAATDRFNNAARQLKAHRGQRQHQRHSAGEEAQRQARENASRLRADLEEDSEEENEDDTPHAEIGEDLDIERQRFHRRRRRRHSPSSTTERVQGHVQSASDSRESNEPTQAPDDFPGMEEVWRYFGLDAAVENLKQAGKWSLLEKHWDDLRNYDVMWEFRQRWARLKEDGQVAFDEFLDIWERAQKALAEKGRADSRDSAAEPSPDHESELEENPAPPDYTDDPDEESESVYLENDFHDALIRSPGIDPNANDWTRRFFELHVFHWRQLVDDPATTPVPPPPEQEDQAPDLYGPGDRKGKKPAYRILRGGYEKPYLSRTYRRKLLCRRRCRARISRISAMINYFNPGDMANSGPRQAPSPGPQHQTNGIGGNPMTNLHNSVLPAGQQADMNHLWGIVEQLSQVLAENRAQTRGIVNSVQQIQSRATANGTSPTIASLNHDLQNSGAAAQLQNPTATQPTTAQQLSQLTRELTQLQNAHSSLQHSQAALLTLLTQHETLLDTHILPQLRRYAHSHTLAITSLHAHYQKLLEDERQQNLELRLEHQKWQEGLGRVSKWARMALRESAEEEGRKRERERLGKLKEENRVLRGLVGWEERGDESEEEEDARAVEGERVESPGGGSELR